MFTMKELRSVDKSYFDVKAAYAHCIVIVSRNTGHWWYLYGTGLGNEVKIQHKHHEADSWHQQKYAFHMPHTLKGALKSIKSHDEYQLKNRKPENSVDHQ